jgi:hypothetical protein
MFEYASAKSGSMRTASWKCASACEKERKKERKKKRKEGRKDKKMRR